MSKALLAASVVWAVIATALLLWGVFGTAVWEHGRLCEDALQRRMYAIKRDGFDYGMWLLEDDIARWCR